MITIAMTTMPLIIEMYDDFDDNDEGYDDDCDNDDNDDKSGEVNGDYNNFLL